MTGDDFQDYPDLKYSASLAKDSSGKFKWKINELECEYTLYGASQATKGSVTLGTVPAGKALHIQTIQIASRAAKKSVYTFKYGTTLSAGSFRIGINVGSTGTANGCITKTGLTGIVAKGVVSLSKNTVSTSVLTIAGVLRAVDPGY